MSTKALSRKKTNPHAAFYEWLLIRYDLPVDATLDDIKGRVIEGEKFRDEYLEFRGEVEKLVGSFLTNDALVEAVRNFKKDRDTAVSDITKKLVSAQDKLVTRNIKWSFKIFGHVFKVYDKAR